MLRMRRTGWTSAWMAACALLAATSATAVEIVEAWSRATPPGAATGVIYMVLRNPSGERRSLMRISSPVATGITLHESSIDAQGVARMWPVASLRLAAGETMRLSPGGRHLMLEGLKEPLKAGTRIPVELQFDGGEAPVTVQVEVRALVPVAGEDAGHHHAH